MNNAIQGTVTRPLVIGRPSPFLAVYFVGDRLVHEYLRSARSLAFVALNFPACAIDEACDGSMTVTELTPPRPLTQSLHFSSPASVGALDGGGAAALAHAEVPEAIDSSSQGNRPASFGPAIGYILDENGDAIGTRYGAAPAAPAEGVSHTFRNVSN